MIECGGYLLGCCYFYVIDYNYGDFMKSGKYNVCIRKWLFKMMVDFGLCGFVISVFLFIIFLVIYLIYGFRCFGGNEWL